MKAAIKTLFGWGWTALRVYMVAMLGFSTAMMLIEIIQPEKLPASEMMLVFGAIASLGFYIKYQIRLAKEEILAEVKRQGGKP